MHRRTLDLNGDDWRLGQAPPSAGRDPHAAGVWELGRVAEWLPATVPGNVRADLLRAGRLPDLARGADPEAAQWVDDHCWWLVREFLLSCPVSGRVHLVLRGVDYLSDVFLNDRRLGRHEGMFSPQVYDISDQVQTHNTLAVRILGSRWLPRDRSTPWEKLLNQVETRFVSLAKRFPQRRDVLKCQMGFGWDFAPALRTMGIWDDVYLVFSGGALIRRVQTETRIEGEGATLSVRLETAAHSTAPAHACYRLFAETFQAEPILVEQEIENPCLGKLRPVPIKIPEPRLWWPWDHGQPDLYRLEVELWQHGACSDAATLSVGLRQVELEGWTLRVNGRRVYARGANWVPADILPGRVTGHDYRALLTLARKANMNMLRVWGGGLREKRAFYDLCDRLGILLWQEFPFACAFLARFPRSQAYLQVVTAEALAIVRDLRNHPSLALWCGGNEFSPERNAPLVAALEGAVAAEDPTRPFLPASPARGDSHNWQVWHNFHPPSAYRDDGAAFASEFGLQAPPDAETLRRFIPEEDLWPPGPSWSYHGAGLEKLRRYARPFLDDGDDSLEGFVQASRRAQAHGLQVAIEHYRRRKSGGSGEGCGGVLVWQLNEPWPAISWALLDFFRQPKPAYETVKRLFNPLLVSADYPLRRYADGETFHADLWVVNDRAGALPGCELEAVLWDANRQPVERLDIKLDVAADSAQAVAQFRATLPAGGGWRLICRLSRDGQALSANEYDLAVCDDLKPTLRQRLWAWITGLVMPS